MTEARWIRVSVEVFNHDILDKGPFDRRSAWLWLIAHAAWKDKHVTHKGKRIEVKRGQVIAGRSYLAKIWGWSEQNVRTFLNQCIASDMLEINQSTGHYANVISITNYDTYQNVIPINNQRPNQSLTSAPPVSNQTLTRDTNTTNKLASVEQEAARDDLAGLNGCADQMVGSLLKWLPNGSEQTARKWLATMTTIHSGDVIKASYAKLVTDMAQGVLIAQPVPTWSRIAQRMSEDRKNKPAYRPASQPEHRVDPSTPRNVKPRLDDEVAHA